MSLLTAILGIIFCLATVSIILEYRRAKDKKKCIRHDLIIGLPVLVSLFLFGPLFLLSPLKLGHTVIHRGKATIVYPTKLGDEGQQFSEAITQAEARVGQFYATQFPTRFLLVANSFDMLRYGGNAVGGGGASSPLGIVVRRDRLDAGVLTHELSHRYLRLTSAKKSPCRALAETGLYYPRWFDEGLATYLGDSGYMARFTNPETLKQALAEGEYPSDLNYWNGLSGYINWAFKDVKRRPVVIYTQGYLLVKFLAEEFGEAKLRQLLAEGQLPPSFESTFQKVYGLSVADFHQQFLENLATVPPFK